MLGIGLGVAALIIVLSIMNGFQKEVRNRMLSLVSHVEVVDAGGAALRRLARDRGGGARAIPQVVGAAPFVVSQALIAQGDDMRGVIVRGIVPDEEATVTELAARLKDTTLDAPRPRRLGRRARRRAGAHARRARGRQGHASSCPAARSRRPAWCRA